MGKSDPKHVRKQEIDDDTDIFEIIIFTLSPVLGGREQVLATPFIECVKYVELENKKRKNDRWNRFMDAIYSDTSANIDKMKRQKYIERLQPEQARKNLAKNTTDIDQLKQLKEQQAKEQSQMPNSANSFRQGG